MNYNSYVFTVLYDIKGFPYIEKNLLYDRVKESAIETTSPRGVMPKTFVDGCKLCVWTANGKLEVLQTFPTEVEARKEWLDQTYVYDYLLTVFNDFETVEKAIADIAETMRLKEDVVKSLLRHHELYRQIESKKKANQIMVRYYRAKKNANGKMTKELSRAMNDARYPFYHMYGTTAPNDSPLLDPAKYYTEEFLKEIECKTTPMTVLRKM